MDHLAAGETGGVCRAAIEGRRSYMDEAI